jgi:hypothetical protein
VPRFGPSSGTLQRTEASSEDRAGHGSRSGGSYRAEDKAATWTEIGLR